MKVVMALFAFVTLAAFLGVLVWHIPDIDLIVLVVLTAGLAGYDFLVTLARRNGR
jgi:hypothetical protein